MVSTRRRYSRARSTRTGRPPAPLTPELSADAEPKPANACAWRLWLVARAPGARAGTRPRSDRRALERELRRHRLSARGQPRLARTAAPRGPRRRRRPADRGG